MKWSDIYVSASATWLGRRQDVRDAVADGRYVAVETGEDGCIAVRVADDLYPPDMAVAAARLALARLLSTLLIGDSTHESTDRGTRSWGGRRRGGRRGGGLGPIDLRSRGREYLATGVTGEDIVAVLAAGQRRALQQALGEAWVRGEEVARFVVPNGRWWSSVVEPERTTS
ncbi:hypothetical protein ABZX95_49850 [Streptomyces sp. NPDC004232]|uniref:hypothetical protein n=1 Tax=Streptomyces sp. NPDC004232 TaxID=3154454 RepID=UPI0033B63912